jgi:endonuclease/exonuclease/phosphatase family metal-dependent hydrolase
LPPEINRRKLSAMRKLLAGVIALLLLLGHACAQTNGLLFTTLNCYFFFGGGETTKDFNQPKLAPEYWRKATNLIALLPTNAPLIVGLQEIGRGREALHLAQLAAARYKLRYAPLFAQGKDTYTGEDVGALMCYDLGWKLATPPARDPALDNWLSKHLVFRLTNAVTTLDVCVVHLRRALGATGIAKQQEQTEALKIWARQHLKDNPNANLIILGDFNETKKPGDAESAIAPLVKPNGPLVDTFTLSNLKPKTHANGKAYDRILISPAIEKGEAGLKFDSLSVQEHKFGKGPNLKFYTDHFPLTAKLILPPPETTR